jgi:peptide/nickel transport system permease protein
MSDLTTLLPSDAPPGPAARRETFWAVAGRAYWKALLNRLATAWALLVILTSTFVPFVAGRRPYTAIVNDRREFPLFHDLTRVDLLWLIWAAAAAVFAWIFWRTGKRPVELETLRALRVKWLAWLGGAAIVATLLVVFLKTDFLDVRNYPEMQRAGQLSHAVFPPLRWGFADQEPLQANRLFEFPTRDHLLGTDGIGRDALARLLWSTRIVLEIGLVSEIIALAIGVLVGAISGYFVGRVDIFVMRFVEIVEAIPTLFLLLTFIAIFGRQLFMIMVIIGITGWTGIARFTRAEFLKQRSLDYVAAARSLGLPLRNILFKHMLPNCLTPVIVTFTFGVAGAIVSESILSFLGIGVEPPTASWGAMLNEAGNPGEEFRWWLAIAPGLLIFLTVFAYNIIGEGLRDATDPKTNKIQ